MSDTFKEGPISSLYLNRADRHFGMRTFYYNGIAYLETPEEEELDAKPDDKYFTVQRGEEGRLDIIANRAYGDPSLWWLIASVNGIFNPFVEVIAGMKLRVPSRESIVSR
jgi:hypothetical protein